MENPAQFCVKNNTQKVSPRINLAIIAAFAVEPNAIELFDIDLVAEKGGAQRHMQKESGRIQEYFFFNAS
jgi:hypothetical protein